MNKTSLEMPNPDAASAYLFIYPSLSTGGIQTYIVRLANWLVARGGRVTVVLQSRGELDHLLDRRVDVKYGFRILQATLPIFCSKRIKAAFQDATVVFALEPMSSWITIYLIHLFNSSARIIHGVLHPRHFFWKRKPDRIQKTFQELFRSIVALKPLMFMNTHCQRSHEEFFGTPLPDSLILPLPINIPPTMQKRPRNRKILSIGRLTSFKTYNMYMIDVVGKLVSRGFKDVTWDVYGAGPLKDPMGKRVAELGLDHHVFIHDAIPYDQCTRLHAGCEVFVGMGTALVEACASGCPGVPAIESNSGYSYGLFHESIGYEVGEYRAERPTIPVADLLTQIFEVDDSTYEAICEASRNHAKQFSIDQVGTTLLRELPAMPTAADYPPMGFSLRTKGAIYLLFHALRAQLEGGLVRFLKAALPAGWIRKLRVWSNQRQLRGNKLEQSEFEGRTQQADSTNSNPPGVSP